MNRMTDEQIRIAKNVIASVGRSKGLEDIYRKKAMDTTGDPENWIQVLLIDMIIVGIPCILHRATKGNEEDERMELASSKLTEAVATLSVLARDTTISDTDFGIAKSALSLFTAIMLQAQEREKEAAENRTAQSESYIKNDNKNPLW